MLGRIIGSIVTLVAGYVANSIWSPVAGMVSAAAAGGQFNATNVSAFQSLMVMNTVSAVTAVISALVFVVLLLIWFSSIKRGITAILASMLMLFVLIQPQPSYAYYDSSDKTEVYTILPNQSAFWIPNQGDNQGGQVQLNSEDYLSKNKVSSQFFVIPHFKLSGSGGKNWTSGWDYFVPSGRLIIVDRTPVALEWVDSTERGTSAKKEGFPCQSNEGLNITVGISIGTSVSEANAAKFLYNFGIFEPQETSAQAIDPQFIFQSVYYGHSLYDSMQSVVRKNIQTLVCNQVAQRTLDQDNKDAVKIMEMVKADAEKYLNSVGIDLKFIGWADTFTFDPKVQEAINRLYVAKVDQQVATTLASYTGTIQALATAEATRSFGEKVTSWPSTVVGTVPDIQTLLGAFTAPAVKQLSAPAVSNIKQ